MALAKKWFLYWEFIEATIVVVFNSTRTERVHRVCRCICAAQSINWLQNKNSNTFSHHLPNLNNTFTLIYSLVMAILMYCLLADHWRCDKRVQCYLFCIYFIETDKCKMQNDVGVNWKSIFWWLMCLIIAQMWLTISSVVAWSWLLAGYLHYISIILHYIACFICFIWIPVKLFIHMH